VNLSLANWRCRCLLKALGSAPGLLTGGHALAVIEHHSHLAECTERATHKEAFMQSQHVRLDEQLVSNQELDGVRVPPLGSPHIMTETTKGGPLRIASKANGTYFPACSKL
jgi:hypothetical protein